MNDSAPRREIPVSGWYACLALFNRRPDAIRRILVEQKKTKLLGHVLAWASKQRLPYRVESNEQLARVAGTSHHEGVVLVAQEKPVLPLDRLTAVPPAPGRFVLALESVGNPHNLGAILRTSAFFGVDAVILGGRESPARLSPAILRTSQGGAEEVDVHRGEDLAAGLKDLKAAGFGVVGTDVFGKNIFGEEIAAETASGGKATVLILGSERGGMTPPVRDLCDRLVRIPGPGDVESLNVSVACGVFLALYLGRRGGGN